MKSTFKILAASAFLSMSAAAASATVIDAFNLDVTSAAGTDSTAVLAAGVTYELQVSGTFTLGNNPTRHVADAEFFNLASDPLTPLDATNTLEIGVGVDGQDIDFGAFNASHVYTALIVGTGSTINVFYSDSPLGDNRGSLQVQLSTVPVPAGIGLMLTALGGLGFARRFKSRSNA